MADIKIGIVKSYDPKTCTSEITSYDGLDRFTNVGNLMSSYDPENGVYSYTPPSINSPCLYTEVDGEVIILGQYAPPNLGYAPDTESTNNTTVNRSVDELQTGEDHLPGDWQMTSQSGAEITLRNMIFNIKMNPLFYSAWNLLNSIWDNMCNIFRLHSPGADVLVDLDESGNTSTSIQVRTSVDQVDGTPMVDLKISSDVDILLLKINGESICKIDKDRNVMLSTNNVSLEAHDIHVQANNMYVSGSRLDCSGVGRVRLPR